MHLNINVNFQFINAISCSACAQSVEKAIKRLSGIKEVVDVFNNKDQVSFYRTFVNVSDLILHFDNC